MTKGTRTDLFNFKPKLTKIEIHNKEFYLRDLTVGETNKEIFGKRMTLIELAEQKGIELDLDDELKLSAQLRNIYDPYHLARTIATRLCDEHGNNFYDPTNLADLDEVMNLDGEIMEIINKAIVGEAPKNSQTDVSSK